MKKLVEKALGFEVVEIKEVAAELAPIDTIYEDEKISVEILNDRQTYYVTDVEKDYSFVGYYIAK
ncbi:hypothetical protein SAMN02745174_02503 [Cetobacterium ceti]|uniref:Uncharacterized protein n=1 Tax=Cetobacterium ceti TaxID=180163 RepID=A0A1T4QYL9_9FUSO|nr:hypothetical protein [Cetobacterium ceti]SKA08687.1 hypothetical protein SAMN02745174_02503 [Cetobacterium ceti]